MLRSDEYTFFKICKMFERIFNTEYTMFCDMNLYNNGYLSFDKEAFTEWLEEVSDFDHNSESLEDAVERLFGDNAVGLLKDLE